MSFTSHLLLALIGTGTGELLPFSWTLRLIGLSASESKTFKMSLRLEMNERQLSGDLTKTLTGLLWPISVEGECRHHGLQVGKVYFGGRRYKAEEEIGLEAIAFTFFANYRPLCLMGAKFASLP